MAHPDPPDPGLPIKLEPCSNGEFAPPPVTPLVAEVIRRANETVDDHARRLGISRRWFLRSALGATTTLAVLSACSREAGQTGGRFDVEPSTTTAPTRVTPSETTMDPDAAAEALGPLDDELIVDVQGHLLEFGPEVDPRDPGFPQSGCGEIEPTDCYGIDHFLDLVFGQSDTDLVMLSAIPFAPGALSPDVMTAAMEAADRIGCTDRVLMQGEAFPTLDRDGVPGLEAMVDVAERYPIRAFKTYTHAPGPAWRLDDDLGQTFLDQVGNLGVGVVAVHKGLAGGDEAASPADIGPAARDHPEIAILVYHSGYEAGAVEGPYDGAGPGPGVDRLIASVQGAGFEPGRGANVYAELGSTWRALMARPDEAAHVLGKLLVQFGPDNILWGTDSIWYGSPQDQIEAFRAFRISDEFQDRFGYPALTDEIKAKILGHNAARLFDLERPPSTCEIDRVDELGLRAESPRTDHTHAAAGRAAFRRFRAGLH